MAPFSVADLKSHANKAKDFTSNKISTTRDRYSSAQSKDVNWETDEFKRKKPPPPPRRIKPGVEGGHDEHELASPVSDVRRSIDSSRSPPPLSPASRSGRHMPPPVPRDRRPEPSSSSSPSPVPMQGAPIPFSQIDWANLTADDKQVFFGWLDEYFAMRAGGSAPSRTTQDDVRNASTEARTPGPTPKRSSVPPPASALKPAVAPLPQSGPPPIPLATRPKLPSSASSAASANEFTTSHPPSTIHGSAALDLTYYFSPDTYWDSPWYASTSSMIPPPLQGSSHIVWKALWETSGPNKTVLGCVIFSDLSICWYSVKFSTTSSADPNDSRAVQRAARYLPRPKVMDRDTLLDAHETYGETIAGFAESFVGSGQFCARGECWDLASEALKYFEQFDYVPKPVPSISRTHGHLIFQGKVVTKGGAQAGRWRGGDDRVRRGDIVEWRSVFINMAHGAYASLGDPDHTAVVVSETVPRVQVYDGMSITPAEVGTLEVVEQSVGRLPSKAKYDMAGMTEGEVWIYRPIGMQAYLGVAGMEVRCPEGVAALSL